MDFLASKARVVSFPPISAKYARRTAEKKGNTMTSADKELICDALADTKPAKGPGLSDLEYQAQLEQLLWTVSVCIAKLRLPLDLSTLPLFD